MKPSAKILLLAMLTLPVLAYAQVIPAPLSLSSSPASPSPGTTVAIQAATPTFDKDTASFSWTVDGKSRPDLSGRGKNEIALVAGAVGSQMRVSVRVSSANDGDVTASLVIRVSDLSLTWFGETTIPRWYRGKALAASNSVVDIVAVPEFIIDNTRVAPENLIYHWTLDDQTNALSGLGADVFRIKTSDIPGTQHQVEVMVEDIDRKIQKNRRITITPTLPRTVIYRSTPLGGIEPRTTAVPSTQEKGLMDFAGEAFFFPTASKHDLGWSWDIGGTPISNSFASPYFATIDSAQYPQGSTALTLRVSYTKALIPQSASKILNLFLP